MQTRLPGYRDRIVHVSLNDETEGGLNLNMPPPLIVKLGERGEEAAKLLMQHFTLPAGEIELSWDNHRWVRYRTMMGLLEELMKQIEFTIKNPAAGDRSYLDLLLRESDVAPNSYEWKNKSQRTFAHKAMGELLELIAKWESLKENDVNSTFTTGTQDRNPSSE